jgi:hypothetical protein
MGSCSYSIASLPERAVPHLIEDGGETHLFVWMRCVVRENTRTCTIGKKMPACRDAIGYK